MDLLTKAENSKKLIHLMKVPDTSILTIKSPKNEFEGNWYYKNLLQVIVRNQTFIYDLDDESG